MTRLAIAGSCVAAICYWWPRILQMLLGGPHRINYTSMDHLCWRCRRWAALRGDTPTSPDSRAVQATCEGALAFNVRQLRSLHKEMHDGEVAHDGGAILDGASDSEVSKLVFPDRHRWRARSLNPVTRWAANHFSATPLSDSSEIALLIVPPFVLGALYGSVALLAVILRG